MRRPFSTGLALLVLVTACAGQPDDRGATEAEVPPAPVSAQEPADLPIATFGHYVWGHEASSFTPCGAVDASWADAPTDVAAELRGAVESLTSEPYQEIYVLVRAVDRPRATDGFAEDYETRLEIVELLESRTAGDADCGRVTGEPVANQTAQSAKHPIETTLEECFGLDRPEICLDAAFRAWDTLVNEQYRLLLGRLESDQALALRESQRAWVSHRDAEFDALDQTFGDQDGTVWAPLMMEFRMNFVKNRALTLSDWNAFWT